MRVYLAYSQVHLFRAVMIVATPLSTLNAPIEYSLLSCFWTGLCDKIDTIALTQPTAALQEIHMQFGVLFICITRWL